MLWKFAERISAQMVSTLVSIILARLLDPEHYGIISIVMIFITIANVFVSDGLGSALIQKKDADALDFSSVLYVNILISFVLYGILFIGAPFISSFYGEGYEILTSVLRVLGIRIILSAINSIQQAYISKKMIFRMFFWATLIGTVTSAFVGLLLAFNGAGVWALVGQYLTNTTIDTIVLAFAIGKLPLFKLSLKRVKNVFGYGMRILTTSLLMNGFEEFRALLIGKCYSSSDLAFYDRGQQFPKLIVLNINTSIASVLFPKMAGEQDNKKNIKKIAQNSIKFSSFIMAPMMLGLAAISYQFVKVILTDKWLPCVNMMRLFCVFYLFQPIHTANIQAIKALGRADTFLKLEMIKKAIELVVLIITIQIGLETMVASMALLAAIFMILNAYPNKNLIDYSIWEQLKDCTPNILCALIMAAIVWMVGFLPVNNTLLLFLQIVLGVFVYVFLSFFRKSEELKFFVSLLKK